MTLTCPDHQPFLSNRFDVHDYANAVLQGRAYRPDEDESAAAALAAGGAVAGPSKTGGTAGEKGDLGVEVARLNYGIVSEIVAATLTFAGGRDAAVEAGGRLTEWQPERSADTPDYDQLPPSTHTSHDLARAVVPSLPHPPIPHLFELQH